MYSNVTRTRQVVSKLEKHYKLFTGREYDLWSYTARYLLSWHLLRGGISVAPVMIIASLPSEGAYRGKLCLMHCN